MVTNDFLSTWSTEFAIHHFDLIENLERDSSTSEVVKRSLVTSLDALTESPHPKIDRTEVAES